MKRVIAVMLVMVLLAGCVGSMADDFNAYSEETKTYVYKMLKVFTDGYEDEYKRTTFDADCIYLYYIYLKEQGVVSSAATWENFFHIKNDEIFGNQVFFNDTAKSAAKTSLTTDRLLDEQFEKWIDGEVSDDKFLELVYVMASAVLKAKEELSK